MKEKAEEEGKRKNEKKGEKYKRGRRKEKEVERLYHIKIAYVHNSQK